MEWLWAVAWVLAGLLVGGAVNGAADRMPRGAPLLARPACPWCGQPIPLLASVTGLGMALGRTWGHTCAGENPRRHALVPPATAALFLLDWLRLGLSWPLLSAGFVLCVLVLVFVVDLEHRLVLNRLILPASVVALILTALEQGPVAAAVGGAIGLGFFALAFLIFPRGLGMGDVKLGLFIGVAVGWPSVLPSLAAGIILGGLVPLVLLLLRRVDRRGYLPYAPFLATGAMAGLLFGGYLVQAYLRLYGM